MAVVWNIVKVESNISDGAIKMVHWEASDYETEQVGDKQVIHRGRRYGSVHVDADPSSENYIAWDDVTKDIVIGWVKSTLGEEEVADTESQIAGDITLSKTPVEHNINPWDVVPEVDTSEEVVNDETPDEEENNVDSDSTAHINEGE
jgi:hypothetical protein